MASSSNLLGKRKPGDDLETKPVLKKHKDKETKSDVANLTSLKGAVERKNVVFVSKLSHKTEISDIVNFFKDVGKVVRVRLKLGLRGKRLRSGFVEFASANEAKKGMQMKNGEYLRGSKIHVQVANKRAPYLQPKYEEHYLQPIKDDETPRDFVEALEEKDGEYLHDHPNFLMKGLDKTPNYVEEVLLVANISPHTTEIEHIINFFKDVGKVVGVRLIVNHECKHVGYCFVEFGCAEEAKKALEEKNGKYLHDHQIFLMKGLDETPDFVEENVIRKKTLFVGHLSRCTQISDIINFFKDVGEVVNVRLKVNHRGRHKGYGYVEFASANEARKALEEKKGEYLEGRRINLDVLRTAQSLTPSNYHIDHKVWYEDYLRRESLEDAAAVEGLDETPEEIDVRKKTLFFAKSHYNTIINDIKMFKRGGEIVRVQLIVDHKGVYRGCGFLEFASANEAKNELESRNSVDYYLKPAEIARYSLPPKYKVAQKLWYEDNLQRRGRPDFWKTSFSDDFWKTSYSDEEL